MHKRSPTSASIMSLSRVLGRTRVDSQNSVFVPPQNKMDEDSEAASSNGVDLSSPVPPDDEILRNLLEAVLEKVGMPGPQRSVIRTQAPAMQWAIIQSSYKDMGVPPPSHSSNTPKKAQKGRRRSPEWYIDTMVNYLRANSGLNVKKLMVQIGNGIRNAGVGGGSSIMTKSIEELLLLLDGLKVALKNEQMQWLEQFSECGGFIPLCELLNHIVSKRHSKQEYVRVEWTIVQCIKLTLATNAGVTYITNHTYLLSTIITSLDSRYLPTRATVCDILTYITAIRPAVVKRAFIDRNKPLPTVPDQLVQSRSSNIYSTFISALDEVVKQCGIFGTDVKSQYKHVGLQLRDAIAYILAAVTLVNTLIDSADTLEERIVSRMEFMGCGFNDILQKLKSFACEEYPSLFTQTQRFGASKNADDDQSGWRNIKDPYELAQLVVDESDSKQRDLLTEVLQMLHTAIRMEKVHNGKPFLNIIASWLKVTIMSGKINSSDLSEMSPDSQSLQKILQDFIPKEAWVKKQEECATLTSELLKVKREEVRRRDGESENLKAQIVILQEEVERHKDLCGKSENSLKETETRLSNLGDALASFKRQAKNLKRLESKSDDIVEAPKPQNGVVQEPPQRKPSGDNPQAKARRDSVYTSTANLSDVQGVAESEGQPADFVKPVETCFGTSRPPTAPATLVENEKPIATIVEAYTKEPIAASGGPPASLGPPPPPVLSGPGGPPPPPPPPGGMMTRPPTVAIKFRPSNDIKLKAVQFDRITDSQFEETLWKCITNSAAAKLTSHKVEDILGEETFRKIEEHFGSKKVLKESTSMASIATTETKIIETVKVFDDKKANNMGIALVKLVKLEPTAVKKALLCCDHDVLLEKYISSMMQLLPTHDEFCGLKKNASDPNLRHLEKFWVNIMGLGDLEERLFAMHVKTTWMDHFKVLDDGMNILLGATRGLESKKFHSVLDVIRVLGNYMNFRGKGAILGFKMNALKRIENIKSNDGKTFLTVLVDVIEEKMPEAASFVEDLRDVVGAAKLNSEELKAELSTLKTNIQRLRKSVVRLTGAPETLADSGAEIGSKAVIESKSEATQRIPGDHFWDIISEFVSQSEYKLRTIDTLFKTFCENFKQLVTLYGEDNTAMKPEEFFSLFKDFVNQFEKTLAQNSKKRESQAIINKRKKTIDERRIQMTLHQQQAGIQPLQSSKTGQQRQIDLDSVVARLKSGEVVSMRTKKSRGSELSASSLAREFQGLTPAASAVLELKSENETLGARKSSADLSGQAQKLLSLVTGGSSSSGENHGRVDKNLGNNLETGTETKTPTIVTAPVPMAPTPSPLSSRPPFPNNSNPSTKSVPRRESLDEEDANQLFDPSKMLPMIEFSGSLFDENEYC